VNDLQDYEEYLSSDEHDEIELDVRMSQRFEVKLSDMLSDPRLTKYVCWSDDGMSIVIPDSASFEKEVLQTTKFSRWV
jgi:hypothetical protein